MTPKELVAKFKFETIGYTHVCPRCNSAIAGMVQEQAIHGLKKVLKGDVPDWDNFQVGGKRDVSLCKKCGCMTHTVTRFHLEDGLQIPRDTCGKCEAVKE